ncbi:MAG: phosphoribosylformylglycinamidine synthase I [Bacteroidia bacterium]|jgi:phosphoribosylformylglycinamidine synthase I
MKFGVVIFPGSNCDHDLIQVLEETSGQKVEELWHKSTDLKGCDFIFIPGGFSFGDYLRSGAIAKLSPIMHAVVEHANNGGYVMGICNGFQILCESGLLDGALLRNENQLFICDNVHLKTGSSNTLVTANLGKDDVLKIPIAHAEGRYYADSDTVNRLVDNDQVLFYYCNASGDVNDATNPNGSVKNIAGITNGNRNVFGMMPHPERAASEKLFNTHGRVMFESILASV